MPELVWKHTSTPKAASVPEEDWQTYKALLCQLYQQMTLEQVMQYMVEKYQFVATRRQYTKQFEKWGVRKYRTASHGGEGSAR